MYLCYSTYGSFPKRRDKAVERIHTNILLLSLPMVAQVIETL